jgi:hypothetical protein
MSTPSSPTKTSRVPMIVGWVLTILVSAFLTFSAVGKLLKLPPVETEVARLGYTMDTIFTIGIVELACVIVYLFPRTAVLGAILLTGYLGGATATHVRIADPFFGPVIIGVVVWVALFLRDRRVRALAPWRTRA